VKHMRHAPTLRESREALESAVEDGHIRWTGNGWISTPAGDRYFAKFLAELPSRLAICDFMIDNPDLSINGFDDPAQPGFVRARADLAMAVDQFDRAVTWLRRVPRTKTPKAYSYWLKHQAEGDAYIANGAFLCAGLHLGFVVKRQGNLLNARMGVGSLR
jgi:hypothetical protein